MADNSMNGAMQPIQPIQDLRGAAAVEDVVNQLNPQQLAMLAMGKDPFGADSGMLGGQPGVQAAAQAGDAQAQVLAAQQVVDNLYNALAGIQPNDETSALAAASIQTAIDALTGGLQK